MGFHLNLFLDVQLQRKVFSSLDGRSENDIVLKCLSKVIQRPQLAQHFNCEGKGKAGSLLHKPADKRNFIGTECQKCLLCEYP